LPRANLEHLRNEAKQRLKTMQAQDPGARLAAVQLAIAREYGFASWRRLKAAVDEQDRARLAAAHGRRRHDPSRAHGGFNPGAPTRRADHPPDRQNSGHTDLELFMRQHQERDERHDEVKRAVRPSRGGGGGRLTSFTVCSTRIRI
jgi:hypothetical protein